MSPIFAADIQAGRQLIVGGDSSLDPISCSNGLPRTSTSLELCSLMRRGEVEYIQPLIRNKNENTLLLKSSGSKDNFLFDL